VTIEQVISQTSADLQSATTDWSPWNSF